jgi:diaminopimelate decarboxylase
MPKIKEGDILAIMNTGAYGYSMASNYNLRPTPAEILLTENKTNVIRRRQTFEDMFNTETQ